MRPFDYNPQPAMHLYSIGHSNASITDFLALLERFRIALLADTRSKPYSRYNPHFSRQPLAQALQQHNIEYVFMGQELGGRPAATEFYFASGKVDYEQLAAATFYQAGIDRLLELGARGRVAFMCSEGDYKKCHRYWLITRTLVERGSAVEHILHSGKVAQTEASEFELLQPKLFAGKPEPRPLSKKEKQQ